MGDRSDHGGSIENRTDSRVGLLGQAIIIPCPARCGRKPVSVAIRDLSPLGIGVIYDQQLDPGEQFILRVPGQSQTSPTAILCTVVYCRSLTPAAFSLGARFVGRVESGNSAASPRLDSGSMESMTRMFQQQAAAGLSQEEAEQVREVEERLRRLVVQ
jgi:hypothetical protein